MLIPFKTKNTKTKKNRLENSKFSLYKQLELIHTVESEEMMDILYVIMKMFIEDKSILEYTISIHALKKIQKIF